MIVYPNFPLPARRGRNVHAWGRLAVRAGSVIGKGVLLVALAAVFGILAGSALGFVAVIALI